MFSEILRELTMLDEVNAEWEEILLQQESDDLEHLDQSDVAMDLSNRFRSIIDQTCNIIKENDVQEDTIQDIFSQRRIAPLAQKLINQRLYHYNKFEYLRKTERENPFKARQIFDLLWTQYVLRIKKQGSFDPPFPMDEDTYKTLAVELDTFTDFCVSRQMHIDSIFEQLKDISQLSHDLCTYISQTIDKDFEKLKLNYLINQQDQSQELLMQILKYLKNE